MSLLYNIEYKNEIFQPVPQRTMCFLPKSQIYFIIPILFQRNSWCWKATVFFPQLRPGHTSATLVWYCCNVWWYFSSAWKFQVGSCRFFVFYKEYKVGSSFELWKRIIILFWCRASESSMTKIFLFCFTFFQP